MKKKKIEKYGNFELEKDEEVLQDWTKTHYQLRTSIKHQIVETIQILTYFSIYAFIAFIIQDNMNFPIDNTIKAFTFPMLSYIFIAYRGILEYLKAVFATLFVLGLSYVLLTSNVITWQGISFLHYTITIVQFLSLGFGPNFDQNIPWSIIEVTAGLFFSFFVFEFVLLMINVIFIKRNLNIQYKITNKNIYLRTRTKKSSIQIFKYIILILINPFHVKLYSDIIRVLRFNKMTTNEGKKTDLAKIPREKVEKIKKSEVQKTFPMIISIILTLFTGFLVIVFQILAIPIFTICFIWFLSLATGKSKYNISIAYKRKNIEGSWKLTNSATKIDLLRIPQNIADFI